LLDKEEKTGRCEIQDDGRIQVAGRCRSCDEENERVRLVENLSRQGTPPPLGVLFFILAPAPPSEGPSHLLVVIDTGLKLSPAWEAEAGSEVALATTGAPNVWERS